MNKPSTVNIQILMNSFNSDLFFVSNYISNSNYIKQTPKTLSVHRSVTAPRPQFQSLDVDTVTLHAASHDQGFGY